MRYDFSYAVVISNIIINTTSDVMSVDVRLHFSTEFPDIEIFNISIDHLDDLSGIKLPINFNAHNFRETPALLFDNIKDEIYFKESILRDLKKTTWVLNFFEPELISQRDDAH